MGHPNFTSDMLCQEDNLDEGNINIALSSLGSPPGSALSTAG